MLIQGTNVPIKVTFDTVVSSFQKIVATLWIQGKEAKKWETADMTIESTKIYLPLTEEETRGFKPGKAKLEIKGANSTGQTVFWEEAEITIKERKDKNIDLIE